VDEYPLGRVALAAYPLDELLVEFQVIDAETARQNEQGEASQLTTERIRGKYWPPVRRIDNAFGDRNLVCSCPSPEAFESH
jgi:glycine dehydrogenase